MAKQRTTHEKIKALLKIMPKKIDHTNAQEFMGCAPMPSKYTVPDTVVRAA